VKSETLLDVGLFFFLKIEILVFYLYFFEFSHFGGLLKGLEFGLFEAKTLEGRVEFSLEVDDQELLLLLRP